MIEINKVFSLIEKGKRIQIEDSIYPPQGSATTSSKFFLVCDGVGGENKGEVASKIVANTIGDYLNKTTHKLNKTTILAGIEEAIQGIRKYAIEYPEAVKMSTTLTLASIQKDGIWLVWCGDSKIYHFRNGEVLWKSKDHSLVQHLVDLGEITEEMALTHPRKNVITRSISATTKVEQIDFYFQNDIQSGDYLLLASDGIFEQMDEAKFKEILISTNTKKEILVNNFCDGNTNDNYSMYLLSLSKSKSSNTKLLFLGILIMGMIGVFLGVKYLYGVDFKDIVFKNFNFYK